MARPGKLQFLKPPILKIAAAALIGLPPGAQLSASAPTVKFQIQCDIAPNIAIRQVGPAPRAVQLSVSAPATRFQPADQVFIQPLTLRIKSDPVARQVDQSAPTTRWIASVGVSPNLSITTLQAVQVPFIANDTAQWQGKYHIECEAFPNLALFLIPPVVPVISGGSNPGAGGGGSGKFKFTGERRRHPHELAELVREAIAEEEKHHQAPESIKIAPESMPVIRLEDDDDDEAIILLH